MTPDEKPKCEGCGDVDDSVHITDDGLWLCGNCAFACEPEKPEDLQAN